MKITIGNNILQDLFNQQLKAYNRIFSKDLNIEFKEIEMTTELEYYPDGIGAFKQTDGFLFEITLRYMDYEITSIISFYQGTSNSIEQGLISSYIELFKLLWE